MKTITIDGREYRIKILPPWLHPYLTQYDSYIKRKSETEEDEAKQEAKIKSISKRILSVVTPPPDDDDVTILILEVCEYLNKTVEKFAEDAKSFRKDEDGV